MAPDLTVLVLGAGVVAVVHTAIRPDLTAPLIAMGAARGWSAARSAAVTLACTAGHLGSSVLLGVLGCALGASLRRPAWSGTIRLEVAASALIVFGLLHACWAARRAGSAGHTHDHGGADGLHALDHVHDPRTGGEIGLNPWILLAIVVFRPCELLIPLCLYPAATGGWGDALLVAGTFSVVALLAALAIVLAARAGPGRVVAGRLGRLTPVLAGSALAVTGGVIRLLA